MDKTKLIESATKLVAKGSLDKAVKEYQRILESDPDDVRVLQKLAELYQKMNRKAEAADCFEKVARTYSAQGFYLKAVALYKQVLKVIERVEVNIRLAELYQQLGLVGDATKEWQAVAAHYEKAGDTKQALDTLKKLVDLDPDNVAARIRLGEQYARQEQVTEAVTELRRAATYLQRNGRQDDYLRVAERISHLDQNDIALAKELAENWLGRGDAKRALAKLQICFKANAKDLGTLQMLARAFQELGQVSKTVSVMKELARVHADAKNVAEARRTYQQALQLAPDDGELKVALQSLSDDAGSAARPPPAVVAPPPPRPAPAAAPRAADPAAATGVTPAAPGSVPKLLKETEVYVKYGLHEKALEHLRRIFAAEPDNVEAHEKAKAVAQATNRTDEVIASLATLIRLYVQAGAREKADGAKAELRALDASHEALSIGGAARPAAAAPAPKAVPAPAPKAAPAAAARPAPAAKRAPEPIALEDEGEIEVATLLETEPEAAGELTLDEPGPALEPLDEELPAPADEVELLPEIEAEAAAAEGSGDDGDEFASELAEADFYIQAGLLDDARSILEGITLAAPDHPGAVERLQQIGGPAAQAPAAAPAAAPAEHGDDLAAELAAELASETDLTADQPLDADILDPFQVPAHEVLGEFRAKVQQIVRPEDVQTHYDLGIAYKEMGLLDEAIAEFDLAYTHGGGKRAADCLTMLGTCELEKGNGAAAVEKFQAGLALPELAPEAAKALRFELGAAFESLGQNADAVAEYVAVQQQDGAFRDVAERIQRLGGAGVAARRAPAKGAARTTPPRSTPAPAKPAAAPKADDADAARKNRKIGFV